MSVGDFIYYENVLSKESCDSLIRYFEDNIELAGPGMMGLDTPIGNKEIHLQPQSLSDDLKREAHRVRIAPLSWEPNARHPFRSFQYS